MSNYRPGYYPNFNISALNEKDSVVNSSGLLDGCLVIFYTSPEKGSLNALTLNTSDSDEPKLIKQKLDEDKQDNYIFKLISSDKGYMIQSISKNKLFLVPSSNNNVYGSKSKTGVWKFTNIGGKSSLKCKLQPTTMNDKKAYLSEVNDDIKIDDKGESEFHIGFIEFGKKAFEKSLDTNPYLQQQCCNNKLKNDLQKICENNNFKKNSSKCDTNNSMDFDIYEDDEDDLYLLSQIVTDDSNNEKLKTKRPAQIQKKLTPKPVELVDNYNHYIHIMMVILIIIILCIFYSW
jgi:hypothetical protein